MTLLMPPLPTGSAAEEASKPDAGAVPSSALSAWALAITSGRAANLGEGSEIRAGKDCGGAGRDTLQRTAELLALPTLATGRGAALTESTLPLGAAALAAACKLFVRGISWCCIGREGWEEALVVAVSGALADDFAAAGFAALAVPGEVAEATDDTLRCRPGEMLPSGSAAGAGAVPEAPIEIRCAATARCLEAPMGRGVPAGRGEARWAAPVDALKPAIDSLQQNAMPPSQLGHSPSPKLCNFHAAVSTPLLARRGYLWC